MKVYPNVFFTIFNIGNVFIRGKKRETLAYVICCICPRNNRFCSSPSLMPSLKERSESICVWLISIILLITTFSGGLLLVLVLLLPEDNVTRWFPEVGLTLVGMPWMFWFVTAMYRCFSGGGGGGTIHGGAWVTKDLGLDEGGVMASPGAKRVRFGLATVVSSNHRPPAGNDHGGVATGTPEAAMALEVRDGDIQAFRSSTATTG